MKQYTIWILNRADRLNGYQYTRFIEEGLHLNIKIEHVIADDFQLSYPPETKKSITYKGQQKILPDGIITRQTGMTYQSHSLLQFLQHQDIRVINTSQAIHNAEDKYATTQCLSQAKIPIPKTILLQPQTTQNYLTQNIGFPFVIKTIYGAKGDGVFLVTPSSSYASTLEKIKNTTKDIPLLAQEFIASSRGRDLRVFVVGDKAIGCVQRSSANPEKQFKANVALGGTATYIEITPEIEKIAVQSTKALGLDIAGVDLLFTNNGYTVCEVNSSPSFEGFEKDAHVNVPRKILEYTIKDL